MQRNVRLMFAIGFLLLLAGSSVSASEVGTQHLEKGLSLLEELYIDEAIAELQQALDAELNREQQVECYDALAFAYITNDETAQAEQAYLKLLRIDKTFEPYSTSPKVRQMFEKALQQVDTTPPPILTHVASGIVEVGKPFPLEVEASDESGIAEVTLTYELPGMLPETTTMEPGKKNSFHYTLPKPEQTGTLKYRIRATDTWGNQTMPLDFTVSVIPKKKGRSLCLLGGGASTVVAITVGLIYYLVNRDGDGDPAEPNWPADFPEPPQR